MSNQERPTSEQRPEPAQRATGGTGGNGRSGSGADSAMKQLREWEQRRADDRESSSGKPSNH